MEKSKREKELEIALAEMIERYDALASDELEGTRSFEPTIRLIDHIRNLLKQEATL